MQQAYTITVINAVGETAARIELRANIFPNPSTEQVQLHIEGDLPEDLQYQLFDANGRLLQTNRIATSQTSIALDNVAAATYYLKVLHGTAELKQFKVVKN